MTKLIIGVDLDETLINNKIIQQSFACINTTRHKWTIKNGVIQWLPKLYEIGCRFHVITARNHDDIDKVRIIIGMIEHKLKVKFESITTTNLEKKGKYAQQLNCKYLIDDYHEYLSDCNEHNVIPILLGKKKRHNMICYKSWKEIYDFIVLDNKNLFNNKEPTQNPVPTLNP